MIVLIIFGLAALAAMVAMSIAVQRRSGGYYAHRAGLDRPAQATTEQETGTTVDFPLHHP